jgi:hypothetical protein
MKKYKKILKNNNINKEFIFLELEKDIIFGI